MLQIQNEGEEKSKHKVIYNYLKKIALKKIKFQNFNYLNEDKI